MSQTKRRILIADDDAAIRSLLRTLLEDEGYSVAEARSGVEALKLIEADKPDLFLLDLRMPEMSGLDVLQQIRERSLGVSVILMTAFGTSSSAIQAIQLGAYDYINKPFEIDDVLLTVQRVFEHLGLSSEVQDLRGQLEA